MLKSVNFLNLNFMKIAVLSLVSLLISNYLVAQNDFLKYYKAPNYVNTRLIVNFEGKANTKINSTKASRLITLATYSKFLNTKKIQGYNYLNVGTLFTSAKNQNYKNTNLTFVLNHYLKNKIYLNQSNWFVGISDFIYASQFNTFIKDPTKSDGLTLRVNPTISFGKGRLEPVHYARRAYDIEKALLKSNSIKTELSTKERTLLANEIAKIKTKRFYDSRLNRISQLKAIDSLLQTMELIHKTDITYFSYLSDAFNYAHYTNRKSGSHFEIGLSEGFYAIERSSSSSLNQMFHALNGFMAYEYHIPSSYQIQHSIKASIILGKERYFWHNNSNLYDEYNSSIYIEYNFGYYPNTRTYLDLKAFTGITNDKTILGIKSNFYYYLSPKIRFKTVFLVNLLDEGYSGINISPFLNDMIYNDYTPKSNKFLLSFGLNYAIF